MIACYRAAYVPDLAPHELEDAAALAVRHVDVDCALHDRHGLLITPCIYRESYFPVFEQFVTRHGFAMSPRSRGTRGNVGLRPTLVHTPDEDILELAVRFARGWSLTAVEVASFPLAGWAAATNALDLRTGQTAARPAAAVELLDRLHFAGNSGWADAPGRRDARRLLGELRAVAPELDGPYLAGFMIGSGRSASRAKRLRALVDVPERRA